MAIPIERAHVPPGRQGAPRLKDRNLVPLAPVPFNDLDCPVCGAHTPAVDRVRFIGLQVIADQRCANCGTAFVRDMPIGFQCEHPLAYTPDDRKILTPESEPWIGYPQYAEVSREEVRYERRVFREHRKVIILNTLDHLYGHVLLKLFNAQEYLDRYPDHGLIIITQPVFAWMIPKGVAEVWYAHVRLGRTRAWHAGLDTFVQEQLPRYEEVHLARCWPHPDTFRLDIGRFTGEAPFPLAEFTTRPPHITFIAREDRLWFPSPLMKFLFRALNPLGLRKALGRLWVGRQTAMVREAMRRIRAAVPDATFSVVGLSRPGGFDAAVEDLRSTRMTDELERAWCKAYAKSHVVVGVHGSNMLLPTAHAIGMVEILPHDRHGNIVQDVTVRWKDRMQLFLYRFVDEFAPPAIVADHVVRMIQDLPQHRDNYCVNIFDPAERP